MKSQWEDHVLRSVLETRAIRNDLDDEQFITWYADRYKVLEKRVKGILDKTREMSANVSIPAH